MTTIYLDITNDHLASKKLSLDDYYNYVEGLLIDNQTVCIYDNVFSKNPSVCFKTHKDFTEYWDTVEAKKTALLDNVKAFKAKPNEVAKEE